MIAGERFADVYATAAAGRKARAAARGREAQAEQRAWAEARQLEARAEQQPREQEGWLSGDG